MSDNLRIDIDINAAKKSLDSISKAFGNFARDTVKYSSMASKGAASISDRLSKIKPVNAAVTQSLTSLSQASAALKSGDLNSVKAALESIGQTKTSLQNASIAAKELAISMKGMKAPPDVSQAYQRIGNSIRQVNQMQAQLSAALKTGNAALKSQQAAADSTAKTIAYFGRELINAAGFMGGFGVTAGNMLQALRSMQKDGVSVKQLIAGLTAEFGPLGAAVAAAGAAFAGFNAVASIIGGIIGPILEASTAVNNFRIAVDTIDGSGAGQKAFNELNKLARETGQNVLVLAKNYGPFRVANQAANVTAEDSIKLYGQFSGALRVFGADAMSTERAFKALTQMFSKGKIMSEELRQQLGDSLPGAVTLLAKAMDISTASLQALLETGSVGTENLFKLGDYLEKTFGSGIAAQIQSVNGQMQLFGNNVTQVVLALGSGGLGGIAGGVAAGLAAINEALDSPAIRAFAMALGDLVGILSAVALGALGGFLEGLLGVADALGDAINWVVEFGKTLLGIEDTGKSANEVMTTIAQSARLLGMVMGTLAAGWIASKAATLAATAANGLALASQTLLNTATNVGAISSQRAAVALGTQATATAALTTSSRAATVAQLAAAQATKLWNTFLALSPVGKLITVVAAAYAGYQLYKTGVGLATQATEDHNEKLGSLIDRHKTVSDGLKLFTDNVDKNAQRVIESTTAFQTMEDRVKDSDQALKDATKGMDENSEAYKRIAEEIGTFGRRLSDSAKDFRTQATEAGILKEKIDPLIDVYQTLSTSMGEFADQALEASKKFEAQADVYVKLDQAIRQQVDALSQKKMAGEQLTPIEEKLLSLAQAKLPAIAGEVTALIQKSAAEKLAAASTEENYNAQEAAARIADELTQKYGQSVSAQDVLNASTQRSVEAMQKLGDATKGAADGADQFNEKSALMQASSNLAAGAAQVLSDAYQGARNLLGTLVSKLVGTQDELQKTATNMATLSGSTKSLEQSLPTVSEAFTAIGVAVASAVENFSGMVTGFTSLTTSSGTLSSSLPAVSVAVKTIGEAATLSATGLTSLATNFDKISASAPGITLASAELELLVDTVVDLSSKIDDAVSSLKSLTDGLKAVSTGFDSASKDADAFESALDDVIRKSASVVDAMNAIKEAADAAFSAAQQASSAAGGGNSRGGREGGTAREVGQNSTAILGSSFLKTAPQFAEGTSNTSKYLSKLPGGGIPSILHPNEAVVPLSKGRSIPVELSTPTPAQTTVAPAMDLSDVSRGLDRIADSINTLGRGLQPVETSIAPREMPEIFINVPEMQAPEPMVMMQPATQFVDSPDGLTSRNVPQERSTSQPVAETKQSVYNININVEAKDADSFMRTQDQIARRTADRIRKATKRF